MLDMSQKCGSGWIQPSFDLLITSNGTKSSTSNGAAASSSTTIPKTRKRIPESQPTTSALINARNRRKKARNTITLLSKYAPKNVGDLAIHHQKLAELKRWFDSLEKSPSRGGYLAIFGPSGCGKSTAFRALAAERGYSVIEWTNPQYSREVFGDFKNPAADDLGVHFVPTSQTEEFKAFLGRSSRCRTISLDIGLNDAKSSAKQIVLIKELPNVFYQKPEELHAILKEYRMRKRGGSWPIVFIVSTNADNSGGNDNALIGRRLLTDEILDEIGFNIIRFNCVANSLMVKALRRIIDGELLKVDKQWLNSLVELASGDLRFAINQLEMFQIDHVPLCGNKSMVSRDSGLSLFRVLGRCLYSKRDRQNVIDSWLPEHLRKDYSRPYALEFDPEIDIERTGFQASTFNLFLEENVVDFFVDSPKCDDVETLAQVFEIFSFVDCLSKTPWDETDRMRPYELNLPSRAVAFYTYTSDEEKRNPRTWKALRRPEWLDTSKTINKKLTEWHNSNNASSSLAAYFADIYSFWDVLDVSRRSQTLETTSPPLSAISDQPW